MSRRNISQREAHALSKRVAELELEQNRQRSYWSREYPGGVCLGQLNRDRDWLSGRLEAASQLQHAIVVKAKENGTIEFYALPLPK